MTPTGVDSFTINGCAGGTDSRPEWTRPMRRTRSADCPWENPRRQTSLPPVAKRHRHVSGHVGANSHAFCGQVSVSPRGSFQNGVLLLPGFSSLLRNLSAKGSYFSFRERLHKQSTEVDVALPSSSPLSPLSPAHCFAGCHCRLASVG